MAHIDTLIEKIADPALREALREQVDTLLHRRSFGLVFQEHKPETVELPNYRVRRGCQVRIRKEHDGGLWIVENVSAGLATLASSEEPRETRHEAVDGLVVVREFGEAIYPGLRSVGSIERGRDKPFNCAINAENYHALETLLYAYEGSIDAIYIDPPYNSGARDWKYNNDYVDGVDQYRHSKWLAFMQRRLLLAQRLLNPESSVLVVTIDEKEVHHLGMLLEQMFPTAVRQMVTIVINAPGQARKQELARVDEYAFFIFIGDAQPQPGWDDLLNEKPSGNPDRVRWESLLRSGTNSRRADRPALFYPIFIDAASRGVIEIGESKSVHARRTDWVTPPGAVTLWPLKSDGSEGNWRASPAYLRKILDAGYVRIGEYRKDVGRGTVWYLGRAALRKIQSGEIKVTGRDSQGAVVVTPVGSGGSSRRKSTPKTVWNRPSHHAGWHGSALVRSLLPGRDFPFPKALYAVEDTLRIAVGGKPNAVVLDFFAGSGTTAHALARLNKEDGGSRRSILVTNNEVSADEARELSAAELAPGSSAWDEKGIFYHITKPRLEAAFTGRTPDGREVQGTYVDGSYMRDGLEENVEFFELTYEDPDLVSLGRKFQAIAPLLWLKAGAAGNRISERVDGWALPTDARYGVLFDPDQWRPFVEAVKARDEIAYVYIITDSQATFQQIIAELPAHVRSTQLYEDYLRTFQINTGSRK